MGRWIAFAICWLIALVLAITKTIHSSWNHERAAASITGWSSQRMAGRGPTGPGFTFGRVDYAWLPAVRSLFFGPPVPFDVWDVTIWDPEGHEVLHAPHVHAGIRLDRLIWAQFRSYLPWRQDDVELHFVDGVVETLRCHIKHFRHATVNLVAAFADNGQAPRSPRPGGLVVSVEGASVRDGTYRMDFANWAGEITHFEMRLDRLRYSSFVSEQQPVRPAFTYHASRIVAPAGLVVIGNHALPLDRVAATEFSAENPHRQDIVMKGVAHGAGADVAVDGRLTDVYSDRAGVNLTMGAHHGRRVLAMMPSRGYLGGDVSTTVHIVGPFKNTVIEGRAENGELHIPPLEATGVAGRYRIGGDTIRFHDVTGDVAGGHVAGTVTLAQRERRWDALSRRRRDALSAAARQPAPSRGA